MEYLYTLVMNFADAEGKTVKFSYKYANPEPEAAKVKAAMEAIIANGSIFKKVPVSKKDAYLVETETTSINVA